MGTVIQDKQQRNDDHHLRWERTRRAALLDPYRDLHAQGCSLPQAAKGLWRKVRFLGRTQKSGLRLQGLPDSHTLEKATLRQNA